MPQHPGSDKDTMFDFALTHQDVHGAARTGSFQTPHGQLETPVFAPVGTQGSVKGLTPRDLREAGATLVLANTYHLHLRPGSALVESFGGLHGFMGWTGPMLTDSGGYQVFSLARMRRIDAGGVTFRSHLDGSEHRFTPESAMAAQEQLGADIIMCLDECPEPSDRATNEQALIRTHAWAARCKLAHRREDQALFGIVQGGVFADLRLESAAALREIDFPGFAIGGLSVGESKEEMYRILDVVTPALPAGKPRYLMGVGSPEDLVEGVARGVDIFDCVLPTRVARNGGLFTRGGRINIRNAQYNADPLPIEPGCDCYACQHFSRAYLRHLFRCGEILGLHLATVHNVRFIIRLMHEIRAHIRDDSFESFRSRFLDAYTLPDQSVRQAQREAHSKRRALSS